MLPTLLTTGNLLLGSAAVLMLTIPQAAGWGSPLLETAVWCVVLAGVFDAIDGPIARWGNRITAPWGREFDALADLVSFGLAPAILLGMTIPVRPHVITILLGILYVVAGAWRLARFLNTSPKLYRGRFEGLPITAAGLAVAAFWLFENEIWGRIEHPAAAYILVAVCSLLMVSRLEFEKFPEFGRRDRRNTIKWWLACGAIALIAVKPEYTGLPIALLYSVHGPLMAIFRLKRIGAREGQENRKEG